MKLIYVKPQEGLTVLDERTARAIPAAGANLPDTPYVRRRLKQGDLVEVKETAATAPAPAKKKES